MSILVEDQEEFLDIQFGFTNYYAKDSKTGWLLNYYVFKDHFSAWKVTKYFVDNNSNNFKTTCTFFPTLLIECENDLLSTEEYLKKKYEGLIQNTEIIEKVDISEYNHLNKEPKKFIRVYLKTDSAFQQFLKDIKDILISNSSKKSKDYIYSAICNEEEDINILREFKSIHEYDIPIEIQIADFYQIRCGKWYNVSYDGENYSFHITDRITHPDLRIFAFDIETTKPPLKFPNADFDEVMMISILTESFGELIVNRCIVSQNITEFDYMAKDDMGGKFRISNEANEEALLIRFIELLQEHKPHLITTYNGSFFDWPFIEKRMRKYSMDLKKATEFQELNEYYECPFIVHIDCYKWVKRDSYLPMNNHGLKDVAKTKLGYYPDEIDPEDMVRFAKEDPHKLASYSVSDAVATYFLYHKFVHPHIYSLCTLIPMPPAQTLCKGSGTLCEALLISEASNYNLLIPLKKKSSGLEYYNGHIVETLTYIGGHVESLKAGIFRTDFETEFNIDNHIISLISDNLDDILQDYVDFSEYNHKKQEYITQLEKCTGNKKVHGAIYHLDVGAMYPNIILTNRLQPISIVNDDVCVRCDFNNDENKCKKKMGWVSRVEYIPPGKSEITMIKAQLEQESYQISEQHHGLKKIGYKDLPNNKQDEILKERVVEYSRNIYKKAKKTEEVKQELVVCQREIPFYVETVRKFRDQRYVFKRLYQDAIKEYENDPTSENKKKVVACNSIQVAYKCVLNSFYGYVMREGSRWFSLKMAAAVCHVGGEIIKLAKEFVDGIGTPLELDTDGIWCLIPKEFPCIMEINGKKVSMLSTILNYFVCKKFTNYQYQIFKDGKYEIEAQNSIFFEVDGPYKSMIIPSSTEENKLLKKRYVVFDDNNKIVELKGFELKRRGELNFIKKFQEDIFSHFNDGKTLQECYDSLASICNYWLDIIHDKGGDLDEDTLFYLFSESRNMSKSLESYANRKSNIINTAIKLSQFLGNDILEEKLKCEFIISKYPLEAPVADRVIPVMIFKNRDKELYLKKWLKTAKNYNLNEIIDWDYYRIRFENILQRLIVIPAFLQNVANPISRIEVTSWIKDKSRTEKLLFIKPTDIENMVQKRKAEEIFFSKKIYKNFGDNLPIKKDEISKSEENVDEIKTSCVKELQIMKNLEMHEFLNFMKEEWLCFYKKRLSYTNSILEIALNSSESYEIKLLNMNKIEKNFKRTVYLETSSPEFFNSAKIVHKYICHDQSTLDLIEMHVSNTELKSENFLKVFEHFSIKKVYFYPNEMYEILTSESPNLGPIEPVFISSFNYQKKQVYCLTNKETVFLPDFKHPNILATTLEEYKNTELNDFKLLVVGKSDIHCTLLRNIFYDWHILFINIQHSGFLDSVENIMKNHISLHYNLKTRFHQILDVSTLFKLPLVNVSKYINENYKIFDLLDCALFRQFSGNNILPIEYDGFNQSYIKTETRKPGFYSGFCVKLECYNSLLLSIIEYKSFDLNYTDYDGFSRKDFMLLRNFVKDLVISALNHNSGARYLLEKITQWIKKDSKLICNELREVIELNHQRYLLTLLAHLKQEQYRIVSFSKEILILALEKHDMEGCKQTIDYIRQKTSQLPGYELLNLRVLEIYEKLSFIDSENYYYCNTGKIHEVSYKKLPTEFLSIYFSDCEIPNDFMYNLAKTVDKEILRKLLKMLSFKRDIHGLASNCYKLMKINEYESTPKFELNLNIFCRNCGSENIIKKRCFKCLADFPNDVIEKECYKYLNFCWEMQISGDFYCDKCNYCQDSRLKEYCKCGGQFVKKTYMQEIMYLKSFVHTKLFDEHVQRILEYFK